MPLFNSTIEKVLAEFIPASLNLFFQLIQAADMLLVHLLGALVIFLAMIRGGQCLTTAVMLGCSNSQLVST